jgi:DNA repair protein RecN (Recombination protein N)
MLTQLSIQNFGLIDRISIEFTSGLNILTGETGAGKSIIIDALRMVLGERMAASYVRDPQKPCVLEAVFDLSRNSLKNSDILKNFFTEDDDSLIIHRTYDADGRNKIKINGLAVTISQLKDVGDLLIDFHGPHDHQMLLCPEAHLGMLDRLIDFKNFSEDYRKIFTEYGQMQKKMDELRALSQSREREIDLLSHQIKELGQVPLNDQNYNQLRQDQSKVNNAEKLTECAARLIDLLEGDQIGTSEKIRQAFAPMTALNQTDEQTAPLMDSLTQMQELNDHLICELKDYAENLAFEPQRAQDINQQMDIYDDIKRKFGPTLADAQIFHAKAKEKHALLSNLEHADAELQSDIEKTQAELKGTAQKMTALRKTASAALKKTIEKELTELGITNVKFESRVEPETLNAHGHDRVIFYISPNLGEDLKPLSEIASSGEAARVMLALKKALIKVDPIPVLIFDEIDAQIGGRLGTVTGQKLQEISRNRQVILITHLPQIASFADAHFKITKIVKDGRTLTTVQRLEKKEKVRELAHMMSGDKENEISIKHARMMLTKALRQ